MKSSLTFRQSFDESVSVSINRWVNITFLVQVMLGTGFPSASQFNLIVASFLVSIFPPDVTDLILDGTVT